MPPVDLDPHNTEIDVQPRIISIQGIGARSGTNFLRNLLCLHPACHSRKPIYEDFFLQYAYRLESYVDLVTGHWSTEWGCDSSHKQGITHALTGALYDYLKTLPTDGSTDSQQQPNQEGETGVLVTKTPSVNNLQLRTMFKGVQFVVIVRDGRAQVESGMRSFGWDFEYHTKQWAESAKLILQERNKNPTLPVVFYEQLVVDPIGELAKILNLVGLDVADCDPVGIRNLPVRGSSDFVTNDGSIDWEKRTDPQEHGFLRRFDHWSNKQHAKFNKLAGAQLLELGYEPVKTSIWPWH